MRRAFALHRAGDIPAAEALYRRILEILPEDADAHFLLGCIAQQRGRLDEAGELVGAAIRVNRREPEFHRTLARVQFAQGLWRETVASCEEAMRLGTPDPQDWDLIGSSQAELGDIAGAERCFDRAIAIAPDAPEPVYHAAWARRELGKHRESLAYFRRARELQPDNLSALSGYLFSLNFSPDLDRAEIFREHLECGKLLRIAHPPRASVPRGGPREKLRIAYISPDFRYHAVSFFVEPLLMHHDRARFEVWCCHLHPHRDAMTDRLRRLSDHWIDCAPLSDEEIARRIETAQVDVLVDLAGHTDMNRIAVLARRPAPVIATWLGYLNTTGTDAVDFRITDPVSDPPGATEQFHAEKLLRLPQTQWCRRPPETAAKVSSLPLSRSGSVRFASFNKSSKVTDETLHLWSRLLTRVANSTLLFVGIDRGRWDSLPQAFAALGVAPERLDFRERVPLEEFFVLHEEVDIALDGYPYSGATTTLDSLWMGVPTLTLAGEWPMSRSTASILTALELEDWIARTPEEFLDIAARKAADPPALAALRSGLRERLVRSILMDGPRFTSQLEDLYWQMWDDR